jgi:hypothetical protein
MNGRIRVHGIVLWALAPLLLWLSSYRPEGGDLGRAARLPERVGGFESVEQYPLTGSVIAMLGTPDAIWRRYRGALGEVFVVAVFHDENWKSVHAPDTCLRGSNMEIVAARTLPAPDAGDGAGIGYLRMRAVDRGRDYLSLFAFLAAPDFLTGDYWSFFWHHAPSAVLRRSVPGCLLRVETWVEDGDLAAAEARCRAALEALLPICRDLLR